MIYETDIKIKNLIISIEFDTESEEFSYTIKERKNANAKTESKEKGNNENGNNRNTDSGKSESGKSESGNISDDFLS